MSPATPPPDGAMLTTQQLADALQVSPSTIKRWRTTGKIDPTVAVGNVVRYRWPVEVSDPRPRRARPLPALPSMDSDAAVVVEVPLSDLPDLYAAAITAAFGAATPGQRALVSVMPLEGHLDS